MRRFVLLLLLPLLGLPGSGAPWSRAAADPAHAAPAPRAAPSASLRFLPNCGQWDPEAAFAVLGPEADGWVHADGFSLRWQLWGGPAAGPRLARGAVVRTRFLGARAARVTGEGTVPGVFHFLRGADPRRWVTGVVGCERVVLEDLRPGVDLVLRPLPGGGGPLEYDLLLAPGAEAAALVAECEGADRLALEPDGSLRIEVLLPDGGELVLRQQPPVAWQERDGRREPLAVRFVLRGSRRYGFAVAGADPLLPLTIDPGVVWNSLLGGGSSDSVNDLHWVQSRGIYLGGWAGSTDFPTTPGAFRTQGGQDGFVARFGEDGTSLQFATYLGGGRSEEVRAIAVDALGRLTAVGFTNSADFPTTAGALQPGYHGGSLILDVGDAFVSRLDAAGATLVGSTYLGGYLDDVAEAVTIGPGGDAVVAGWSTSPDLPTTPGVYQPALGGPVTMQSDGFVARIAPDGRTAPFLTYLGGNLPDQLLAVATDALGVITVAGTATSGNFPTTTNAYRTTSAGSNDAVIARLDALGRSLLWSTYLGGLEADAVEDLALAGDGSVWLCGYSESPNFPTTAGAPQRIWGGAQDAFAAHLGAAGSSLAFATYLGGAGDDAAYGLALQTDGRLALVGSTGGGLPVSAGAAQGTFGGGGTDAFLAVGSASGSTFEYLTYFGGQGQEALVAVDAAIPGMLAAGGWTFSPAWPTSPGAFQTNRLGGADGTVLLLDLLGELAGGLLLDPPLAVPAPLFLPGATVPALGLRLRNTTSRTVRVASLRLFVGGSADNATHLREVTLWRDDPATAGWDDLRVAGPLPLLVDNAELTLPCDDSLALQPGESCTLWAALATTLAVPPAAEFLCAVLDQGSWELSAFGAAPRVPLAGPSYLAGTELACERYPELDGDDDGDGVLTVTDLRRLCGRLGGPAGAADPDGDGMISAADLGLLHDRVLGRPVVLEVPALVQRGSWLTIQGQGLTAGSPSAVLGGRVLQLAASSRAELTFRADAGLPTGLQQLRITVGERVVVQQPITVQ